MFDKFRNWVGKNAQKIEKAEFVAIIAVLLALVLRYFKLDIHNIVLALSMFFLSQCYVLYSYLPKKETESIKEDVLKRGMFLGLAVITLGLLFWLQNWPASIVIILVGLIPMILAITYNFTKKSDSQTFIDRQTFNKVVALAAIALFVLYKTFTA